MTIKVTIINDERAGGRLLHIVPQVKTVAGEWTDAEKEAQVVVPGAAFTFIVRPDRRLRLEQEPGG